tara:strand:- start:41547 stop:43028 length:1482 start_codon:yes stop_codon:yes gene_type:complete
MNNTTPRTRFAPSPTGEPHVGNIRTAIFAWLFAKANNGSFIIRIEDTDQARLVEGAIDSILQSLSWLGINWDEGPDKGGKYGPYMQSERQKLGIYSRAVETLLKNGKAYYCSCSSERLDQLRKTQSKAGKPPGYDGYCRNKDEKQVLDESVQQVVRFAMPELGVTKVTDTIRGNIEFENSLIDDFVILKSDGFPTYHLANVVDDNAMEISHVIRAEEWLPSLPRHINLYKALELEPPIFAHVPIILASDRTKLSKRHGATSIKEFRSNGYLPSAMLNFLCLLGWSLDDKTEIFSEKELINYFSIERVSKSSAVFDNQKLEWMNGYYIRESDISDLISNLLNYWDDFPVETFDIEPTTAKLEAVVPLIQDRIKTLQEAGPMINFLFSKGISYDAELLIQKKMNCKSTIGALNETLRVIEKTDPFKASNIEDSLRLLADRLSIKPGQLFGTLRIATTGQRVSPPLFESLEIIGKDTTIESINLAVQKLNTYGDVN